MFPSDMELRWKLGQAYEHIGDYKGAVKQFERMTSSAPRDARGFYSLARCYAEDGNIEKAKELRSKAIAMDPRNTDELLKAGDVMYDQKDYHQALEIYSKALFGHEDLANVHYKIGKAAVALKEYDKAKDHFQKGMAINAENQDLINAMTDLSRLAPEGAVGK